MTTIIEEEWTAYEKVYYFFIFTDITFLICTILFRCLPQGSEHDDS